MAFTITITNAGRAAIVNAQNTGTAPVTIAQIGLSATAIVPAPTMTALAGELKRTGSIAGDVVADDTIHVTAMDESADVYSLRAFGLYLADGTLFAIYGQAAPILEKVAASIALLSIDVIFADIDAASITFGDASFINPPATTERQGVVELATVAEAQAGIDALRALPPAAAKAAILGWLLAQDGSGSGLDADLLDGQHGAYYTNIPARLGYTPANAAGQDFSGTVGATALYSISAIPSVILRHAPTGKDRAVMYHDAAAEAVSINLLDATGAFVRGLSIFQSGALFWSGNTLWHAGNDGSGSGLDADLLDGQHGAYYTNIPARLGYTPVQAGTGVGQLANTIKIGWSAANKLKATVDVTDLGDFVFESALAAAVFTLNGANMRRNGNDLFGPDNDGSGSGLDADLWRGKTPAQHIADYHTSGSNANGQWRKYPDGAGGFVLEQWGTVDLGTGFNVQYADVTFPTPFSGAAPIHISGNGNKGANAGWNVCVVCFDDPTTGGSRITADSASPTQYFNRVVTVRWHAIGKAP